MCELLLTENALAISELLYVVLNVFFFFLVKCEVL